MDCAGAPGTGSGAWIARGRRALKRRLFAMWAGERIGPIASVAMDWLFLRETIYIKEERMMTRRLFRSEKNKMLFGVCGGLGEFLNIDPTLIRIGFVLFCALGGCGVIVYIIAAILMPLHPRTKVTVEYSEEENRDSSN